MFLPLRSFVEVWRTWRNQFVAEFSFPTFRQQRIFKQTIFSSWLTDCREDCFASWTHNGWARITLPAYCRHVHTRITWWKRSCLKQSVLVTWHNHAMHTLRQLFTNIRINTKNIAMPRKQSNEQGIAWPKAAIRGFSGSLHSAPDWLVSKNCTKWFTNNTLLRNTYTFYLHGHRCYVRTYSWLDVILLYSKVLRWCLNLVF